MSRAHVLVENVVGLVDRVGISRCGFLTLTFPSPVFCPKEASARFNSFRQSFPALGISEYVCVHERHANGGVHYHLIVVFDRDIKGRLSDKQIKNKMWGSAPKALRDTWVLLRSIAGKYGFGRTNLMPLYGNGITAGRYIAKYLSKGQRCDIDKGVRLVRYGLKVRSCSSKVTYVNSIWRRACCVLFGDIDVKAHIGSRWAYLLAPAIKYAIDALKGLRTLTPSTIDSIRSYVYYGSSLFSFTGFRLRLSNMLGVLP